MELKKITRLSMFIAFSVVLSIVESLFFFSNIIPGLKIGLANIIILIVLYKYSFREAFLVSILRVFFLGLFRYGVFSIPFFFSLSGAVFSIIFMFMFKKVFSFSIVGISVIGSLFHSLGQIIIGIFLISNINMIYYLPVLLIVSIPTGIIVGLISKSLLEHMKDLNI